MSPHTFMHTNIRDTRPTVKHTYPPAPANTFKIPLSAESWHMMPCFLSLSCCNIFYQPCATEGFSCECDAGLNPKIKSSLNRLQLVMCSLKMMKFKESCNIFSSGAIVHKLDFNDHMLVP